MTEEESKALVPIDLDDPLVAFGTTWERGNELASVLQRLPGEVVLKSGLSSQRKKLLDRWDELETPTLDGEVPKGAQDAIDQWVHDSKVIIGGIVRIGTEVEEDDAVFEVVSRLSEQDWISDSWCWPWESRALAATTMKKKWSKEKFVKAGVLTAVAAMAFIAMVEEEEAD